MITTFRLLRRRFWPDTESTLERNTRYLYLEIAFAAVLSGVVAFNAAFAVRLGASNEVIGLLSSAPALIAALLSVPSARFIQGRRNRVPWLFNNLLTLRVMYGLVTLIPFIAPDYVTASTWLVIWIILTSIPGIFFSNGFQALLAELIPDSDRARVFSRRYVILFAVMVATTILAGIWLDNVPFPINYQLLYLFGFLASLGSQHYLNRLEIPASHARQNAAERPPAAPVRLRGPVGQMLLNLGAYYFALFFPLPLFTIYYIETLDASDGWLGVNAAAGSVGLMIGYTFWERLFRRRPYRWALRRAPALTCLYPVLIAVFPDLTLLLIFNLALSSIHPGVELASLNSTLKLGTPENLTMVMSWYSMVINGGLFLGPLVGVWVAGQVGIVGALVVAGVVRLLAGLLFTLNAVAEPAASLAA